MACSCCICVAFGHHRYEFQLLECINFGLGGWLSWKTKPLSFLECNSDSILMAAFSAIFFLQEAEEQEGRH